MVLHAKSNIGDYIQFLKRDRSEVEALYQDILINVTSFFREPETFEALQESVFPDILKSRAANTPIRIWVPGCSTGQEAYSLAIALVEFLERAAHPPRDPDLRHRSQRDRLAGEGAAGVYPANIEMEVSPERLRRFFTQGPATYRINKSIRDLCVFAKQNVVVDPPFSRIDLISCRNVMIYLSPALQKRIISSFHYALNPNGYLLLGASETVGSFAGLFGVVDPKCRIYAKKATGLRQQPHYARRGSYAGEPVDALSTPPSAGSVDWQRAADRVALGEYAPAGVLVNDDLDILQFRGKTGDVTCAARGRAQPSPPQDGPRGLAAETQGSPGRVPASERYPVRRNGLQIRGEGRPGRPIFASFPMKLLRLQRTLLPRPVRGPGREPAAAPGDFPETPGPGSPARWLPRWSGTLPPASAGEASMPPIPDDREVDRLRQELAAMRDYLQSVIEQQDAVNEELKSANEEILSSNEELRSTNEELETAKEELQSVNEELVTVNEQLQHRNLELTRVSDDLTNLIGSANVPMVSVGVDLRSASSRRRPVSSCNLGSRRRGPIGELNAVVEVPDLEALITG